MTSENKLKFTVKEKIQETPNVVTLKLSCGDVSATYRSGQFLTVFLKEASNQEGKDYTLSSAPHEGFSITVKEAGKFSGMLCNLKVGDVIETSKPYGYFYSESSNPTLILIAGGIGVTPFRSVIVDSLKNNPNRKIILFYSNKKEEDIVFKNEFEELRKACPNFIVKNYLTQEENVDDKYKNRRIQFQDILKDTNNLEDKEIFICGSIAFVRDFWKGLKSVGIDEDIIYTEAFF